eukprot:4595951-Pyramimonas_sp.AAC.1
MQLVGLSAARGPGNHQSPTVCKKRSHVWNAKTCCIEGRHKSATQKLWSTDSTCGSVNVWFPSWDTP